MLRALLACFRARRAAPTTGTRPRSPRPPYLSFRQQLRNPAGDMPAYAATVMSEKDLADIYAFLQALPGRRDVKDFTILNDRGSCVGNHIGRLRLPSRRCMPKSIGSASPAAIWT